MVQCMYLKAISSFQIMHAKKMITQITLDVH